jgi:predicted CoA-substrate-specific enzyme activase
MSAPIFVGIDVGSSATKCIGLDAQNTLLGDHVAPSGFDYARSAETTLARALFDAESTSDDIAYCVATGYGRQSVPEADRRVTEITCHARGAREWYPTVRNIIDVGGQDTKIIHLSEQGKMADYRMNAKCAAGTGTFLESIALKLGVTLSELDELAMASTNDTMMNSYCTVFTGTEVIERVKEGQPREDIAMGLFRSIAMRVMEMMSARDGTVAATGGVAAHCRALVRGLEEVLETEVLLPPMPQHAGAYGAALIASESARSAADWRDHVAQG